MMMLIPVNICLWSPVYYKDTIIDIMTYVMMMLIPVNICLWSPFRWSPFRWSPFRWS